MKISFFSPIYSNPQSNDNLRLLRFTTQFWDFGQKSYTIEKFEHSPRIYLSEQTDKPSWFGIALRIIAVCTIIWPVLMFLGTCLYRAANTFAPTPLTGEQRIGLGLLHDSLKILDQEQGGTGIHENYLEVFKNLAAFDQQEALEMAGKRDRIEPQLGVILKIADHDPKRAYEMATLFFDSEKYKKTDVVNHLACQKLKSDILMHIALKLAPVDAEKAFKIAKMAQALSKNGNPLFADCLGAIAKHSPASAIEDVIDAGTHVKKAFHLIAKAIAPIDADKALELCDDIDDEEERVEALMSVCEELAAADLLLAVLESNDLESEDERIMAVIAKASAYQSLKTALKYLAKFNNEQVLFETVAEISKALIPINLGKGMEMITEALHAPHVSLNLEKDSFLEKVIEFAVAAQKDIFIDSVLNLIHPLGNDEEKEQFLKRIALKMAGLYPEKAYAVMGLMTDEALKEEIFAVLSQGLVLTDFAKALSGPASVKFFVGLIEKARGAPELLLKIVFKAKTVLNGMPALHFYMEAAKALSL